MRIKNKIYCHDCGNEIVGYIYSGKRHLNCLRRYLESLIRPKAEPSTNIGDSDA